MKYQVFTSFWTAVSTLKSNYEVIFAIPNISSVQATEFHSKLPLHLKSLGFLQSTAIIKSLGFLQSIAIITLYSHCNLSEKKQSTEQKKQLSQTRDCLQNRQSKRHIYLSWLFKNYSQVKHTFWQLWSLWYVSVHWNAGTESQTGLHHVLLEEWEHCAKYRRKINERESRDFTV